LAIGTGCRLYRPAFDCKPEHKLIGVQRCLNCGAQTVHQWIDCTLGLGSPEREQRFCPDCKPAIMQPGQRRYVRDLLKEYPLEERLKALGF
jgi:hypothetical protein